MDLVWPQVAVLAACVVGLAASPVGAQEIDPRRERPEGWEPAATRRQAVASNARPRPGRLFVRLRAALPMQLRMATYAGDVLAVGGRFARVDLRLGVGFTAAVARDASGDDVRQIAVALVPGLSFAIVDLPQANLRAHLGIDVVLGYDRHTWRLSRERFESPVFGAAAALGVEHRTFGAFGLGIEVGVGGVVPAYELGEVDVAVRGLFVAAYLTFFPSDIGAQG
ncbi:MAG: hypothetical protein IT379_36395 [Deltaproteobacteria bacterium]|nr:hypothetical protein [Deltaproteobacteria bacterium]